MSSSDQRGADASPTSRRLQREATRSAILSAARQAWAEHGYDDVGLRDIAGRAGVTAALVNRYFGTKKELFREAVGTQDPSPPQLADVPRERFGRHLAELIASGRHGASAREDDYDPTLILLRSAASHAAQPVLRDYVENTVIPPLAGYFRDDDCARERAALVLSLLLGITVLGRMLDVEPLDTSAPDGTPMSPNPRLETILSAMLQAAASNKPHIDKASSTLLPSPPPR